MDSEKPQPFVTTYCDIVEDTDAGIDSDSVIDLVTPTQQSPSPADNCAETVEPAQLSSHHEKVSTHIFNQYEQSQLKKSPVHDNFMTKN